MEPTASPSPVAAGHADEPAFSTYIGIFLVLCVCTALSFIVGALMGHNLTSASIIMMVAVIKALCVATIFMHLKFDWSKLYFIIIPVVIMGTMMMIVLLPDIVLGWHHEVP